VVKAYGFIGVVYLVAGLAAAAVGHLTRGIHPIAVAACADAAATIVVFAFSVTLDNSSCYDPYWSVAPVLVALYWATVGRIGHAELVRQIAVVALVSVWAVRLTWNCLRRWKGLDDEDWRYRDLRARHGRRYWFVSFLGIHAMPTALVFLGCLSLFPALADSTRPFGIVDLAAILVVGGAIWIEALSDRELRRFRKASTDPKEVLVTGVWAHSRHPNYLGEIAFWWGLYLFALAANPRYWWAILGPLAITALFRYISVPMMEEHMRASRPAYARYVKKTPMIVPWIRRDRSSRDPESHVTS
jgi:steroid 5-alpha reductase family enzyme